MIYLTNFPEKQYVKLFQLVRFIVHTEYSAHTDLTQASTNEKHDHLPPIEGRYNFHCEAKPELGNLRSTNTT